MPGESALNFKEILVTLGWSKAKFFRWRPELLRAGVIFYRNEGRPPKRRIYAFKSIIQAWQIKKTIKGEDI